MENLKVELKSFNTLGVEVHFHDNGRKVFKSGETNNFDVQVESVQETNMVKAFYEAYSQVRISANFPNYLDVLAAFNGTVNKVEPEILDTKVETEDTPHIEDPVVTQVTEDEVKVEDPKVEDLKVEEPKIEDVEVKEVQEEPKVSVEHKYTAEELKELSFKEVKDLAESLGVKGEVHSKESYIEAILR